MQVGAVTRADRRRLGQPRNLLGRERARCNRSRFEIKKPVGDPRADRCRAARGTGGGAGPRRILRGMR